MNIKKINKHKTVSFSPFGRIPIQDAKKSVVITLSEDNVKHGNKNVPASCAIALAIRDHRDKFPGMLMAAMTYKSFTLIATQINSKLQALRYVHTGGIRRAINGFDNSTTKTLKANDKVMLLNPTGRHRLGISNGTSHPGNNPVANKRAYVACHKRGVYVDPFHAKTARKEEPETKTV